MSDVTDDRAGLNSLWVGKAEAVVVVVGHERQKLPGHCSGYESFCVLDRTYCMCSAWCQLLRTDLDYNAPSNARDHSSSFVMLWPDFVFHKDEVGNFFLEFAAHSQTRSFHSRYYPANFKSVEVNHIHPSSFRFRLALIFARSILGGDSAKYVQYPFDIR